MDGDNAVVHLDRHAFIGFGVGIVDNSSDNMNGGASKDDNPIVDEGGNMTWTPDTSGAWEMQSLKDVHTVAISITQGLFDAANASNGSDRRAAMVAIGPIKDYGDDVGSYNLELPDIYHSLVYGGCAVVYVPEAETSIYANMWDYADTTQRDDGSMYNILGASRVIRGHNFSDTAQATPGYAFPNSTIVNGS